MTRDYFLRAVKQLKAAGSVDPIDRDEIVAGFYEHDSRAGDLIADALSASSKLHAYLKLRYK